MADQKSVFVSGNFNILHPGHLRLIRFARELGERLTVGVMSDRMAGDAAHIPQEMRLEGVSSISDVDEAVLIDEPVNNLIRNLRPDFVVKGKEHESRINTELEATEDYGGRLLFASGDVTFSSQDLIQKSIKKSKPRVSLYPDDFTLRHKITKERLRSIVRNFQNLRVLVIGDLILDEYVICQPLGMSQEDPTIVVTPTNTERYVGGAGIVSAHAAGFGAEVDFLSVVGDDEGSVFASEHLAEYKVNAHLVTDESRPTTIKQRFRAKEKTLLRVSYLHQGSVDALIQEQLGGMGINLMSSCDLVVFSDFNYGCLPQMLVERLVERGAALDRTMAADSQSSSQTGDVSRFKGMDLLTPTEWEARISLRNNEDGLVILAENIRKLSEAKNIILSMGSEGSLLHFEPHGNTFQTDRIEALNSNPVDVAGAGDSLLITSAMALACGANAWESACIGSIAASVQVSRLGNLPLTSDSLLMEI